MIFGFSGGRRHAFLVSPATIDGDPKVLVELMPVSGGREASITLFLDPEDAAKLARDLDRVAGPKGAGA